MRFRDWLSASFLGLVMGPVAVGQEEQEAQEAFDRTPVACVSMRQIQNTEVVDDRTILFYRRNGEIYLNLLETNCPTLKRNNLFRYRVSSGVRSARLCDYDSITVVDRLTNSLTYNCRLGPFQPIEESRALEMLAAPIQTSTVETVELPEEETVEDSAE